jgi:hypothetical protein
MRRKVAGLDVRATAGPEADDDADGLAAEIFFAGGSAAIALVSESAMAMMAEKPANILMNFLPGLDFG